MKKKKVLKSIALKKNSLVESLSKKVPCNSFRIKYYHTQISKWKHKKVALTLWTTPNVILIFPMRKLPYHV